MAEAAYEGGGSGGNFIEVPTEATITIDFKKMLDLLIQKGFDVDVEIPDTAFGYGVGVYFGRMIPQDPMSPPNITENSIIYTKTGGNNTASIDAFFNNVDIPLTETPLTIKKMLQAADVQTFGYYSDEGAMLLDPFLSARSGSSDIYSVYRITVAEYKSFATITAPIEPEEEPEIPQPIGPIEP